MELKYKLDKPLIGEDRRYSSHCKRSLFFASSQVCLVCQKLIDDFDYETIDKIVPNSGRSSLEIAHLYALKNFDKIDHKDKLFHISTIEDLNSFDNLTLLCNTCHQEYDKPPTYEKYEKMFQRKKNITENFESRNYIYHKLYFYIDEILLFCEKIEDIEVETVDYDSESFLRKMKINNIKPNYILLQTVWLTKYKDKIDFFFVNNDDIGNRLLAAFGSLYRELRKIYGDDKNEIISKLRTNELFEDFYMSFDDTLYEALLAYMIWKCEVLDKNVDS